MTAKTPSLLTVKQAVEERAKARKPLSKRTIQRAVRRGEIVGQEYDAMFLVDRASLLAYQPLRGGRPKGAKDKAARKPGAGRPKGAKDSKPRKAKIIEPE